MTGIPMVYNADTLGIRPDLIGRKITEWKELLNPEFKGKAALVDAPSIGIMDVAMALESRGDLKYGNKGNMTQAEIDKTIDIMTELKKGGHFRAFWTNFDQSVNLMASGEVVIQSMWSPAVTAVRSRNIDCYYAPLKEGYRGWSSLLSPMAHLTGLKADAAMEYLNWYNSGWQGGFIAKQGYYSAGAGDGEELHDRRRVGLLVRRQAGRGRHHGPVRPSDGEEGRHPRRRLVLGPDGQYRLSGTR